MPGQEDPEHPHTKRPGPKIQRDLMGLMDEWRATGLQEILKDGSSDNGFHFKRLADLGHGGRPRLQERLYAGLGWLPGRAVHLRGSLVSRPVGRQQ